MLFKNIKNENSVEWVDLSATVHLETVPIRDGPALKTFGVLGFDVLGCTAKD